ncbi:hypothetical protein QE152_g39895 [Popillia japonica]|uniref:Uncharacterized protein n=1 Tax=Popillia japonica TaxID=7064 RepID=A0AAW1HSW5_POPJA
MNSGAVFCLETELIFIGQNLTADRYINETLANYVVPYGPYIGNDFLLMHDNARPQIICKKWGFAFYHGQQEILALIKFSMWWTCWDDVLGGGRDHRKTYRS